MWKRDEAVRPPQPVSPNPSPSPSASPSASPAASAPEASVPRTEVNRRQEKSDVVNIGKSVIIKGELSGSEDLTIEGQVDGKIELRQNVLTIGPNGKIKAQITAKTVVIEGQVQGNITATERVDIRDNGTVDGDLSAPRVAIADGAHFRGAIDMQKPPRVGDAKSADSKPAGAAAAASAPAAASAATPTPATPATR